MEPQPNYKSREEGCFYSEYPLRSFGTPLTPSVEDGARSSEVPPLPLRQNPVALSSVPCFGLEHGLNCFPWLFWHLCLWSTSRPNCVLGKLGKNYGRFSTHKWAQMVRCAFTMLTSLLLLPQAQRFRCEVAPGRWCSSQFRSSGFSEVWGCHLHGQLPSRA